jgi:hypothetical protein
MMAPNGVDPEKPFAFDRGLVRGEGADRIADGKPSRSGFNNKNADCRKGS